MISRRKAPSPWFSLISASRGWSCPAPGPCSQLKEGIHIPGILQASLALLEHKSSSACSKRTPRTGAPAIPRAEPIERMSGPKMKRSTLIYLAEHLAASVEPSSSLRAGLWRQNLTSAAAGDDKLEKGQHEILFLREFNTGALHSRKFTSLSFTAGLCGQRYSAKDLGKNFSAMKSDSPTLQLRESSGLPDSQ